MLNNVRSLKVWETREKDRRERRKEKAREYHSKPERLETMFTHIKK